MMIFRFTLGIRPRLIAALMVPLLGALLPSAPSRAGHDPVLAVVDIGFVDLRGTGPELEDDAGHRRAVTTAIIDEAREGGTLAVVPLACGSPCSFDEPGVERLRRRAHAAGASHVLVGTVRKIGPEVAMMRVSVFDTASGRMVLDRVVNFPSGSAEGWDYAAHFIAQEVTEALVPKHP